MDKHSHTVQPIRTIEAPSSVDYLWFAKQFDALNHSIGMLQATLASMEQSLDSSDQANGKSSREFFSVAEFACLVERNEYTVREWCRLERIHAEKCETGRGDAKNWKIAASELGRYRNHGLLPLRYLR